MFDQNRVVVWNCGKSSDIERITSPFDPPETFPELERQACEIDRSNFVFTAIRDLLATLDCGEGKQGSHDWNPLGQIIKPGNHVLVKPNMVVSEHPLGEKGLWAAVTSGAITRAMLEYVLIALKGKGKITIGDSPIKETDFQKVTSITGLDRVLDNLNRRNRQNSVDVPIQLIDFRDLWVQKVDNVMVGSRQLPGDPDGYRHIDLEKESAYQAISDKLHLLRSTASFYENKMSEFHNADHHIYSLPASVIDSDVVVCLPKMKTHIKAGVTLCLKNFVGLTNEKRALPHHRQGSPRNGGDENPGTSWKVSISDAIDDILIHRRAGRAMYPLLKRLYRILQRAKLNPFHGLEDIPYRRGGWYGNDTVWRFVYDINRAYLYSDKNGKMCNTPQRRYVGIVDGIIAGEGEGPLIPIPKYSGVLVAGLNPVSIDIATAQLMGFDYKNIPMLLYPVEHAGTDKWPLVNSENPKLIETVSNNPEWNSIKIGSENRYLDFKASQGWTKVLAPHQIVRKK
jgi:uncharacterized protein (DUF362 family)